MILIHNNDKNNSHLQVGELYDIKTKHGIIQKYLSYVDKRSKTLYFSEKRREVKRHKYITYMLIDKGSWGTAHSTKNVIGISKGLK